MPKGRLTRYNQLVSGLAPHYTNVVVQPRGFPIFPDPLLKGQVRFARKTGADFAILNPDNEITLSEAAPRNTQVITMKHSNKWLELGAVLSIGPDEEFVKVKDFDDTFITLDKPLEKAFTVLNTINIFATPLKVAVSAPLGSETLFVYSRYHILAGDNISIETTKGLLTSLSDIKVLTAKLLSPISGPSPFNFQYELELEFPTSIALDLLSSSLFLKAQPSYLSNQVFVPKIPGSSDAIGPFLLDYVSGVLFDRKEVEEQLSVTFFDSLGNPVIAHTSGAPLPVNKQFYLTEMPVMGDVICLWQTAEGSLTFSKGTSTKDIEAVAVCSSKGQFQVTQEVIPPMPPGAEWNITATSDLPVVLRVRFFPNAWRDFSLSPNATQQVLIGATSSELATERIEIVVIGDSGAKVTLGNWVPATNQVFSMVYGITADVFGEAQWQATNVFVKPIWLNFAMGLKGRFDAIKAPNKFDSGLLFL